MRYKPRACLLAKRLTQAGMSQEQLANKTGIDFRQISRYITGETKNMNLDTAVTIAHAIGCRPEELYEWDTVSAKAGRRGGREKGKS